ncbi:MAG: UDP-N-acetylmuramoyl-L-alanyl-D-glutamate--2,6-diaminopimelate ligase [Lentimonas sp.]|jgi:UDP-N-acetylmuramoyl-L-alanyl-D-glutamate--2,6-diaminopimelate ligase
MNWTVQELIKELDLISRKGDGKSAVNCLITDSRRVVPGALFFAINGLRTDGNSYAEEAVGRGAVAVITEQDLGSHFPADFIQVADVRRALALIARRFYDSPDEKLQLAGVTGTNGKTTVSMLAQHLFGGTDQVGLLGTIRYDIGKRTLPAFRTTPESVDVYSLLNQMVENGCKKAVMEISSHGIHQKRSYGLALDVAVFLNLTQDHIDYHKTMDAYYKIKRELFTGENGCVPKVAVINTDCDYGRRLCDDLPDGLRTVTFGLSSDAVIRAQNIQLFSDRTEFDLSWQENQLTVVSPLLGRYNVSNLLAAISIGHAMGYEIPALIDRLNGFPQVPGRMEGIHEGQEFSVLVDYAHTDDALKNACEIAQEITAGKLIVAFGCGGDRDRSKRAPMLRAALDGSAQVFVTSDNPRSEPLEQIFDDMREACKPGDMQRVQFIDDRKRAISLAMDAAAPGDCVLIAGKGHETFQEFNGRVVPFDDRQAAHQLIRLKALTSR